jgi:hypothetical protein
MPMEAPERQIVFHVWQKDRKIILGDIRAVASLPRLILHFCRTRASDILQGNKCCVALASVTMSEGGVI